MSVSSIYGEYAITSNYAPLECGGIEFSSDFNCNTYNFDIEYFNGEISKWIKGKLKDTYITSYCNEIKMLCLDGNVVEVYHQDSLLTKFWLSDISEFLEVINE